MVTPGHQFCDLSFWPFRKELHRAFRTIPDPPIDAQQIGLPAGGIPEPNSLHPALYNQADPDVIAVHPGLLLVSTKAVLLLKKQPRFRPFMPEATFGRNQIQSTKRFGWLNALSQVEGRFDQLTIMSQVEGPNRMKKIPKRKRLRVDFSTSSQITEKSWSKTPVVGCAFTGIPDRDRICKPRPILGQASLHRGGTESLAGSP